MNHQKQWIPRIICLGLILGLLGLYQNSARVWAENQAANQAAVEGHAAVPYTEKIQRIGHKLREIVEQNITNTSTEEDAEEARIE